MIDDLRACTHKQLSELLSRRRALRPKGPLKQQRTHCELEQA